MGAWRAPCAVGLVCAIVAFAAGAGAVQATLPGRNGSITFDLDTPTGDDEFAFNCGTPHCVTDRLFNLDWRQRRARASSVCRAAECYDAEPAWGPGGRSLAFGRYGYPPEPPLASQPDKFYVAVVSKGPVRLVTEPGSFPTWSPDGQRLAFSRVASAGNYFPDIFVLRLADGVVRRLTVRGGTLPDWSSRGWIVFVRHRVLRRQVVRFDVYVVDPATRRSRRLTRDGRSAEPTWSPRGKRITFVHFHRGRPDVEVMNADGSGRRTLVRNGAAPEWSPDGRLIAFVRRRSIWVVGASGLGARRLYSPRNSNGPFRLAWRPR